MSKPRRWLSECAVRRWNVYVFISLLRKGLHEVYPSCYWEKKNSALGSPCLVCFARPDTWKHHFLWSASICSHTTGVLLKVKSEKTTVSGVTLTSHPLVPSSYRVVQLLFMPEALPQLKAWTHICSYNRYLVLFNRYERFIMV